MKNTVYVSIAGIAFVLEEEAYEALQQYFDRIEAHYAGQPEGKEVLEDIEGRTAELILSKQDTDRMVTKKLVNDIIRRLGAPEDISESPAKASPPNTAPEEHSPEIEGKYDLPQRLYRDRKNGKIGGVCAGLGAYFHTDSVLFRLLFALPPVIFLIGSLFHWEGVYISGLLPSAIIVYTVLWIVIPQARTPLQRLEMRGEKITASKIEEEVKQEFEQRNPNANYHTRVKNERNASVFAEFMRILGSVLLIGMKLLAGLIVIGFTVTIGVLLSFIAFMVWYSSEIIRYGEETDTTFLFGDLSFGGSILLLALLVIPLTIAVYGLLRLIFNSPGGRSFTKAAMTGWAVFVLVCVGVTVVKIEAKFGDEIRQENSGKTIREKRSWEVTLPDSHPDSTRRILYIYPADTSVTRSTLADFPVKLRNADSEATEPLIEIEYENPLSGKTEVWIKKGRDWEKRKEPEKGLSFKWKMSNDTLYIHPFLPETDTKKLKPEFNVYLPHDVDAVVAGGLDYDDYTNRNRE